MSAPRVETGARRPTTRACPSDAAARSSAAGCQKPDGHRAGPSAERSRREGERDRAASGRAPGAQRPARRSQLAGAARSAAADHERDRHAVSERAEHEPQRPSTAPSPTRPAVPTAVRARPPSRRRRRRSARGRGRRRGAGSELERSGAAATGAGAAGGERVARLARAARARLRGGHLGALASTRRRRCLPAARRALRAQDAELFIRRAVPSAYRNDRFRTHPARARRRGRRRRSRRSSSARCGWRATRCGSPATEPRRSTRPTRSCPTSDPRPRPTEHRRRRGRQDAARDRRRRPDPGTDRPRRASRRASKASTPAPTTTWSSRSSARSCWPACARCCDAAPREARRRCTMSDLKLNPDTHEVTRAGRHDRPDPARVRAARVHDAQRTNRDLTPAPARRGVGL